MVVGCGPGLLRLRPISARQARRPAQGFHDPLLCKRVTNTPETGTNWKKYLDFSFTRFLLWFDIVEGTTALYIYTVDRGARGFALLMLLLPSRETVQASEYVIFARLEWCDKMGGNWGL